MDIDGTPWISRGDTVDGALSSRALLFASLLVYDKLLQFLKISKQNGAEGGVGV